MKAQQLFSIEPALVIGFLSGLKTASDKNTVHECAEMRFVSHFMEQASAASLMVRLWLRLQRSEKKTK